MSSVAQDDLVSSVTQDDLVSSVAQDDLVSRVSIVALRAGRVQCERHT